jgi:hypothetical protein
MLLDETTCSSPNYKNLIIENKNNNLDTNNYNHIVFIPNQTTSLNTADISFTANDNNINRTSSFRTPSYSINNQSSEFNRLLKQKATTLVLNQNQSNKKSESYRLKNSSISSNSSHSKDKKNKTTCSKKKKDKFNFLSCSSGGGDNDVITTSSLSTTSASSSNNSEDSNSILQHLTCSYSTNQYNNPASSLLEQNNHYQKLFYPNINATTNNSSLNNYQHNLITAAATLNRNQTAAFIYNPDPLIQTPKLIQIVNLDSIVNQMSGVKPAQFYECIQLVNLIDPNALHYENNNINVFNQKNETNTSNMININESEQVYDIIEDIVSRNNSIPNLNNGIHLSPKLNHHHQTAATSQSYRTVNELFKKKYPKTNPSYSYRINNNN